MATATVSQISNYPFSQSAGRQGSIAGIRIQDFSADKFAIRVNWSEQNRREPRAIEICRPYYELWLQYTGRLDWCLQSRGDNPRDIAGTMAADDYWENAGYEVKLSDLASYIMKEVISA
jgi:hypothetical protein